MPPRRSRLPAGASPLEAPEGHPAFICKMKPLNHPVPASALRHWVPDPPEISFSSRRPLHGPTVYLQMTPEMDLEARRTGYAFITPDPEAAGLEATDIKALVRAAVHAAAPDLQFELSDMCLRFASPEDRAAAIARQPFEHDGYSVEIGHEPKNCRPCRADYLVHIILHNYPEEERTEKDMYSNCSSIGHVVEIDPACFTAPGLSPLRLVVRSENPREITCELRLRYVGFHGHVCPMEVARCIIPVEIVKVWDLSASNDGDGRYVSPFKPSVQQRNLDDYLVHINLDNYPREARTEKDIGFNMASIGHVVEIDPAWLAAPDDLSTLRLVVRLEQPIDIPHELQIKHADWHGSAGGVCPREVAHSIVPVEVVKVWDQSASDDGNGGYVSPFKPSGAGAS